MNTAVSGYEMAKDWLVPNNQGERSLLHIHLGMVIFLACAAWSKRGLRSGSAVLLLLVLELLNETADIAGAWPNIKRWRIIDTGSDIFNTMLWPTVLWAAAGIRHRRAERRAAEDQIVEESGDQVADAEAGGAGPVSGSSDGGEEFLTGAS